MSMTEEEQTFCRLGLAVLKTESKAILELTSRINEDFSHACRYMLDCEGRIIVIGMGKSGHIAGKIAATLASTGTPAFFVHPGEASHGDLGMITPKDVVLALSNSGKTNEILTILPLIRRLGVPLIAMTGNPDSPLAEHATVHINVQITQEACPLNLAPTSSTTATLAMGDALAIALLEVRGFTQEDFAFSHPGGNLGRRLLLKIDDLMRTGIRVPRIHQEESLSNALVEVTQKSMGMTSVVDDDDTLMGVFTDGDLRRTLDKDLNFKMTKIKDVMTKNCKTISKGLLAAEALEIMEDFKITALLVVDEKNKPIGALHLHDLLHAGVA